MAEMLLLALLVLLLAPWHGRAPFKFIPAYTNGFSTLRVLNPRATIPWWNLNLS